MIRLIFIIYILQFSIYSAGQNQNKVNSIDSIVSLIPEDIRNNDYYSNIQSSGLIHKKYLGIIKKRIGSVSSLTIHHDTLVFSVSNTYSYTNDNKTKTEEFYYFDNNLIRYDRELINYINDMQYDTLHSIKAYFWKEKLLEKKETIKDDYQFNESQILKVLDKAKFEIRSLKSLMELSRMSHHGKRKKKK